MLQKILESYILEHLEEHITKDYQIEFIKIEDITRSDGEVYRGIIIKDKDNDAVPVIRLDPFVTKFANGKSADEILNEIIILRFKTKNPFNQKESSDFAEYDKVKPYLRMKLVDPDVVDQSMFDKYVSVKYYGFRVMFWQEILLDSRNITFTVITNKMLEVWEITKEQLFHDAIQAETDSCQVELINMSFIYGFRYERPIFGASVITSVKALEQAAERIGGGFYILPSSLHELVLFPDYGMSYSLEELTCIVHAINQEVVSKEDFLSNKIHYYDKENKTLSYLPLND